jgi:hypothetical protein
MQTVTVKTPSPVVELDGTEIRVGQVAIVTRVPDGSDTAVGDAVVRSGRDIVFLVEGDFLFATNTDGYKFRALLPGESVTIAGAE